MATVGLRTFDLHIYAAQSLKEKRFVVSSVKQRLANRFNISIAETGHLDKWQRCQLVVGVVAGQREQAKQTLDRVLQHLDEDPRLRVIVEETEIL